VKVAVNEKSVQVEEDIKEENKEIRFELFLKLHGY
jgi:hypothetical protein